MNHPVRIKLLPLGRTLEVEHGTSLQDALFPHGVEFPCGGHGRCKGCRIKVLDGFLPVTPEDVRLFSDIDRAAGWRLACRSRADRDLTIELAQWETSILSDETRFEFSPRDGFGVAVDLGTTTIVAQLLDLRSGEVRAVRTALNAQARHGADIMSRIEHATASQGQAVLTRIIREQLGALIGELCTEAGPTDLRIADVVLVGNTAMHHLFGGQSVAPLAHYPFAPTADGLQILPADTLGWSIPGNPAVRFLPCLGGFVGSDILAGVLATGLHESAELTALVDLGTNGEMVVGHRERMLCASTAAGPAFEGARITQGMRAITGAIAEVTRSEGGFHCRVLGNIAPRGICGSGLVDAVAVGLDSGRIDPSGRLAQGPLELAPGVALRQSDVRELQLAKGAIAAGLSMLLESLGATPRDLTRLHLAGAFGNYIRRSSAHRIGLLNVPVEKIIPAGNTALLGAKLALFSTDRGPGDFSALRRRIEHVSLSEDMRFHDRFAEAMGFPS